MSTSGLEGSNDSILVQGWIVFKLTLIIFVFTDELIENEQGDGT